MYIEWCNICHAAPVNYHLKVIGDWVKSKPLDKLTAQDVIPLDVCSRCFETEVNKIGTGSLQIKE